VEAGGAPRRALVLAGGGMRVAYQAGALVALEEAGLTFAHADGTSGGTMNLGMLMSGLSPREMCERWRTLRLRGFVSPLPLREYLHGPALPGLGDGDGVRRKVYPHLGIDVERIRAAEGIDATFNVCNYTRKVNEAVHHRDVDMDLLVAAISLPILMPAIEHGGDLYLDSACIKDANLLEAVRRGCDELWLIWGIGNSGVYADGVIRQYVHMIEISAAGSLNEELERIRELNGTRERPVRVHVIRPEWPLPEDPDFFFGRIDAATLIALGYRDACRYLDARDAEGVPLTPDATRMRDPRPGAGWRAELRGELPLGAGGELVVRAFAEVEDVAAFSGGAVAVAGADVSHPALGARVLARDGTVELAGDRLLWHFGLGGRRLELEQRLGGRSPLERLRAAAAGRARLYEGSAELAAADLRGRALPTLMSLHARGVASPLAGASTVGRLARRLASPDR
jgi:predicted acylesterase/phospholipase RssA